MRKLQLALALIVLLTSLALLAWGLWPTARERRILTVPPADLTLPTPSSFEPGLPPLGYIQPFGVWGAG